MIGSGVLWASPAGAHPGYPAIIDSALGVQLEMIFPSQGCQLCHTSASGGTVSLRPFGTHLVSTYGLDPSATEDDPSLNQALKSLQAGDPLLVQDLQKGLDPNPDVTNDPTPAYGCAAAPTGGSDRGAGIAMGVALLAVTAARRARRRT
jgi:hypothetical protein